MAAVSVEVLSAMRVKLLSLHPHAESATPAATANSRCIVMAGRGRITDISFHTGPKRKTTPHLRDVGSFVTP